MKVLVTGGAGFIGSHVCERLLRQACDVTIIDDLNDFYSPSLKLDNLARLQAVGPVAFHHTDITDEPATRAIVADYRPDAIIHLAARAGVRPSLQQPLLYESVNVRGTMVLLEAARLYGVRKFVFASSSSIYGIANRVPFSEQDHLNLPISPYAATKIMGEKVCYTYSHLYQLPVVCLRFFTVYGPRQRPDLAIRKFTEMIDSGRPIPVFGDGSSGRDYTFVDDTVSGILAAMQYDCRYEVFNLGNSSPVQLTTLIEGIEEALGKKAELKWLPEQPGDVPITFADIDKANRQLSYCPRTPLREGLARFVEWYRSSTAAMAAQPSIA
jgi:UDP-glucuronate 4-epimerase